ncbi:MAG: L-seryl-tRNA(Sec) selenium transferase [Candidatus Cloacimonadales bacterium]
MQNEMRKIPGVDKLLANAELTKLSQEYGSKLVTHCIREELAEVRQEILQGGSAKFTVEIVSNISSRVEKIAQSSLRPMLNCTGIVLHTNLGRAPFSAELIRHLSENLLGYSNLEFDLKSGKRGQRNDHIKDLLRFVTKAEDAVVVNNNAAAVMLVLKNLCQGHEAIISRGELVEIGGSFRIPEVMAASGAKMVEVGATNRTRIADYEAAITPQTRVILKVHKSNFHISGFTEEAELSELVALGQKHNLLVVYDMGSGLLRKPQKLDLSAEPDVYSALQSGVDLVTFSGDKLLGGPQAGIIAGKKKLVQQIHKDPMMRALRVGKMTLAALSFVIKSYLKEADLLQNIPMFTMLNRDLEQLQQLAEIFAENLQPEIAAKIIASEAQVGGGTLPNLRVESRAVQLLSSQHNQAKTVFDELLKLDKPILAILREGKLIFDMYTVFPSDLTYISSEIKKIFRSLT